MDIYFVTTNKGKYDEIKEILHPVHLIQENRTYPEIQAQSLEDVVRYGLDHLSVEYTGNFIIEDSGLAIHQLQGFPGVYSAYIFRTLGISGIVHLMHGSIKRDATFQTVLGFRDAQGTTHIFRGECTGEIAAYPRGKKGFGYDPIFIPHQSSSTFAEMTQKEKNRYSHRGKAAIKLKRFLLSNTKGEIGEHH